MAAGNQQGWAWTRAEMMDRFDMATEGDSQGLSGGGFNMGVRQKANVYLWA